MNNPIKILFVLMLCATLAHAQNYKRIDSLKKVIAKAPHDTAVIDTYEEMFWEYYGVFNDTALLYAKKAVDYAADKKFTWGLVDGYRLTGMAYSKLANYTEALRYQQKALQKCDEVNDMMRKANILNNLATIHYELKDYKTALSYQERSLDICRKMNIKRGEAACLGNMGNIYKKLGQMKSALKYYEKSMAMDLELKNPMGYANSLGNIGSIYRELKEYDKALKYYNESLTVRDSLGMTNGIASSYISISDVLIIKKEYDKALDLLQRALSLAQEAGSLDQMEQCYDGMYKCYKNLGKINEALEAYENRDKYKDSILNTTRLEEFNQMKTNYLLEQRDKEEKLRIEKIKTRNEADKFQQRIIIYASIAGLLLTFVFLYFIYKRYKLSLRQQQIIQAQKKIVEVKNKEITDSINYAKRIQEAMLMTEQEFRAFLPASFVLFKPKDIVSGDFYWVSSLSNGEVLVALGDCTGHGVPGGFMSVLGINLLNEIVNERKVHEPDEILNLLRTRVISSLKQDGAEGNSRDGMDILLCKIDLNKKHFSYSSANRSLYVYLQGKLQRLAGNRMPIGYYENDTSFTKEEVQMAAGDFLFLFTDGFVDQNGGEAGKKLMYSNFEALLTQGVKSDKGLDKMFYDKAFEEWKCDHEQIDDVSLIGVRF